LKQFRTKIPELSGKIPDHFAQLLVGFTLFISDCPFEIICLVGASLLANTHEIIASKLAPTKNTQPNEQFGFINYQVVYAANKNKSSRG
jgi:hypothetical protein